MPTLFAFSGLPGTGKSTLSRALARAHGATWLRVDTLEQGLRDLCGIQVVAEGYDLAGRLAEDNLRLGTDVVADCVNPVARSRQAWAAVAARAGAEICHVEVVCSDLREHRRRVEGRRVDIPGLVPPTWPEVLERELDPWSGARVTIDTAGDTPEQSVALLLARLAGGWPAARPPA